jgi:hypothetical protein
MHAQLWTVTKNVLISVKSNIPAQLLGCLFVSEYQLPRTQRDVVLTGKAENTCMTTMD